MLTPKTRCKVSASVPRVSDGFQPVPDSLRERLSPCSPLMRPAAFAPAAKANSTGS